MAAVFNTHLTFCGAVPQWSWGSASTSWRPVQHDSQPHSCNVANLCSICIFFSFETFFLLKSMRATIRQIALLISLDFRLEHYETSSNNFDLKKDTFLLCILWITTFKPFITYVKSFIWDLTGFLVQVLGTNRFIPLTSLGFFGIRKVTVWQVALLCVVSKF